MFLGEFIFQKVGFFFCFVFLFLFLFFPPLVSWFAWSCNDLKYITFLIFILRSGCFFFSFLLWVNQKAPIFQVGLQGKGSNGWQKQCITNIKYASHWDPQAASALRHCSKITWEHQLTERKGLTQRSAVSTLWLCRYSQPGHLHGEALRVGKLRLEEGPESWNPIERH